MKKVTLPILSIITILIVFYFFFSISSCKQKEKIASLEQKIDLLKAEYSPIRFKIIEKENNTIDVAIKFYNSDDKVIRRVNKSIKGNELSFDFYVIPVKGRYLAFPYKIFSDQIAPDDGELITQYYDSEDFPEIFDSKLINKTLKAGLTAVFRKVKSNDFDPDDKYFGNTVHDISKLKEYKTGQVYRVVTHTKGGIEVIEE
ncbi:MAG: hypothetical protein U9N85_05730 [Bacteroidota bacterium]|nr:hypothetical protein [Bacteroidota bacterium]